MWYSIDDKLSCTPYLVSERAKMWSTVTYPDIAFIWLKHWFEKRRVLVLSGLTAWPWPVTIKGHTFGKWNSFWLLQTLWSSVILSRSRTRCRTWISWRIFGQKLKKYLWSHKNQIVLCKKKKTNSDKLKSKHLFYLKYLKWSLSRALNACECI